MRAGADGVDMSNEEKTAVGRVLGELDAIAPLAPECPVLLPLVPEAERQCESKDYLRAAFVVG